MEVRDIVPSPRSRPSRWIKIIPKEENCKKAKWLSEDILQIAVNRREAKPKEKKKDIPI